VLRGRPEGAAKEMQRDITRPLPAGEEERRPPPVDSARETRRLNHAAPRLSGKRRLDSDPLDMEAVPPFHVGVRDGAARFRAGTRDVSGELATQLGNRLGARVDRRWAREILLRCGALSPSVAAGGRSGFSASGGVDTKHKKMLRIEQAQPQPVRSARTARLQIR